MRSILNLALKDLRVLSRDGFALFWIFAFPLMFALFFGSIFGDDGDGSRGKLGLAIVDEARNEASAKLIERCLEHESLSVAREASEGEAPGAVRLHALEEARAAVRTGKRTAFVHIPAGYAAPSPFKFFSTEPAGPALEIGIDPGRKAEAGFLQGVLMDVIFGGMGEMMGAAAPDMSQFAKRVDVSRDLSKRPRSAFDVTFPSAMIWGLMSVAMGFAITLVRERSRGTLLRLQVAPVTHAQMLAGKAFGCFLACMIVMVFLAVFGAVALGVRYDHLGLLLLAMSCTAVCFTGIMMTASCLGRTEEAVAGASWGVMMPFAMIGGGMIPLIAMPSWLVALSDFSPFKWGIYAIEGAVWREFSIGEMLPACGILVAIGGVFFGFGVWLFGRSLR